MKRHIITLLTDFGEESFYVGVMKGVIYSINPEAVVIDLCHTVEPQNIKEASYILSSNYWYFPESSIHLVVVDPGVGSDRRAVIIKTEKYYFVAPDNGVLTQALSGVSWRGISLKNASYWLPSVSTTFHGRDIFAPVVAHLSLGVPMERFGEPIECLTELPQPTAKIKRDEVSGEVICIDRFGNLITNIKKEDVMGFELFSIKIKGFTIAALSRYYAEVPPGELMALWGSSNHLEISVNLGSAAKLLHASRGDRVSARLKKEVTYVK